jgi:endonuclease/exonuclease/phosphatase family metal-dependent hydrolase
MDESGTRSRTVLLLQAAVTLFAVEALRVSGPLLDHVAGAGGVPSAALAALIVYAAPVLVAPLAGWLDARRATAAAVVVLVVLRLIEQLEHTPGFGTGMAVLVVALIALVLVTGQAADGAGGGSRVAAGLALGGAVDVATRAAFGTWDPVWRPGGWAWLYTVLACLALLALLVRAWPNFIPADRQLPVTGRFAVLGLYLALFVLVLGSPAFVASQGDVGLPYAAIALLVGALLAVEAVSRLPGAAASRLAGRSGAGLVTAVLVGALAAALFGHGVLVVPVVIIGQVAAVVLLARAFTARTSPAAPAELAPPTDTRPAQRPLPGGRPRVTMVPSLRTPARGARTVPSDRPSPARSRFAPLLASLGFSQPATSRAPAGAGGGRAGYAWAGLGVGLAFVLVVLPYQMNYELPLPFDNRLVPLAAAVLLGLAGLGARPVPGADTPRTGAPGRLGPRGGLSPLAAVPAVLLLAPVLLLATSPAPAAATRSADVVRLVTWNLHYGVNNDAAVDPASIARVLRAQHPDVILLQEVDRGWPIGGGTDLAEWLSRALAMPYVWSPAADGQFGNVIMSSLPMSDVETGQLPYGAGPQRRSYAAAMVELPSGRHLSVMTAHLQDHTDNHRTRLDQIQVMLRHWHHASPAVIAGDFNAMPGWPEITAFFNAGLVSAQDSTGHAGMLSSPTVAPKYRPDWIFGTSDVSFTGFSMPATGASDHFPLVTSVHLG